MSPSEFFSIPLSFRGIRLNELKWLTQDMCSFLSNVSVCHDEYFTVFGCNSIQLPSKLKVFNWRDLSGEFSKKKKKNRKSHETHVSYQSLKSFWAQNHKIWSMFAFVKHEFRFRKQILDIIYKIYSNNTKLTISLQIS